MKKKTDDWDRIGAVQGSGASGCGDASRGSTSAVCVDIHAATVVNRQQACHYSRSSEDGGFHEVIYRAGFGGGRIVCNTSYGANVTYPRTTTALERIRDISHQHARKTK